MKTGNIIFSLVLFICSAPYVQQTFAQAPAKVRYINTNNVNSLITLEDGTLWFIGENRRGILNKSKKTDFPEYTFVMDNVKKGKWWSYHAMILKTDGTLIARGMNYGQMTEAAGQPEKKYYTMHTGVTDFDHASKFSVIILEDKSLWGTGKNGYPFGKTSSYEMPEFSKLLDNVQQVSLGIEEFVVALKYDGTVWTSFRDYNIKDSYKKDLGFRQIADDAKMISAGYDHFLILKNDGTVWGYGENTRNCLGIGSLNGQPAKELIEVAQDVKTIKAGYKTSALIKNDNSLWIAGEFLHNISGNTSITEFVQNSVFTKIMEEIEDVAVYQDMTVLKTDGTLLANKPFDGTPKEISELFVPVSFDK